MIQIGDQVRHWSRGYMGLLEDDWMMYGGGIGMHVINVCAERAAQPSTRMTC